MPSLASRPRITSPILVEAPGGARTGATLRCPTLLSNRTKSEWSTAAAVPAGMGDPVDGFEGAHVLRLGLHDGHEAP